MKQKNNHIFSSTPVMCQSGSDREMPPRWHPNGSEKKSKFPDERSFQIVGVSGRLGAEETDRAGLEGIAMKKGTIRRRGKKEIIGTWRADQQSLVVETEDAELRKAADEILKTPQTIPVHA